MRAGLQTSRIGGQTVAVKGHWLSTCLALHKTNSHRLSVIALGETRATCPTFIVPNSYLALHQSLWPKGFRARGAPDFNFRDSRLL